MTFSQTWIALSKMRDLPCSTMSRCVLLKYFGTDPSTARTSPFRMMYTPVAATLDLDEHDEQPVVVQTSCTSPFGWRTRMHMFVLRKACCSWRRPCEPSSHAEAILWWIFTTFRQNTFIGSVTAASAVPALFLYASPSCSRILWKVVCCAIAASSAAFASESQQHVPWSWAAGSVVVAAVVATPVSWATPPNAMYYDLVFIVLLISLWPSLACRFYPASSITFVILYSCFTCLAQDPLDKRCHTGLTKRYLAA